METQQADRMPPFSPPQPAPIPVLHHFAPPRRITSRTAATRWSRSAFRSLAHCSISLPLLLDRASFGCHVGDAVGPGGQGVDLVVDLPEIDLSGGFRSCGGHDHGPGDAVCGVEEEQRLAGFQVGEVHRTVEILAESGGSRWPRWARSRGRKQRSRPSFALGLRLLQLLDRSFEANLLVLDLDRDPSARRPRRLAQGGDEVALLAAAVGAFGAADQFRLIAQLPPNLGKNPCRFIRQVNEVRQLAHLLQHTSGPLPPRAAGAKSSPAKWVAKRLLTFDLLADSPAASFAP